MNVYVISILFALTFGAGWLIGFRLGVVAGYDRAEKLLNQITQIKYHELKAAQHEQK